MTPQDRIFLAELYHELTQNIITEAMISYLENISWVLQRTPGRPLKIKKSDIFAMEKNVASAAEKIEGLLESLDVSLIWRMSDTGD